MRGPKSRTPGPKGSRLALTGWLACSTFLVLAVLGRRLCRKAYHLIWLWHQIWRAVRTWPARLRRLRCRFNVQVLTNSYFHFLHYFHDFPLLLIYFLFFLEVFIPPFFDRLVWQLGHLLVLYSSSVAQMS